MSNNSSIEYFVLNKIKTYASEFIHEYSDSLELPEKQQLIYELIRTFDYFFVYSTQNADEQSEEYKATILYGYPSLLNISYTDFTSLLGVRLSLSTDTSIKISDEMAYCYRLIAFMDNYYDLIKLKIVNVYQNTDTTLHLKFQGLNPWSTNLEREFINSYSKMVVEGQRNEYERLMSIRQEVIENMFKKVNLWKHNFIQYTTDEYIDRYFIDLALLDAQQATEWDAFPDDCTFGGINYGHYVDTIIYFMSFAIKHIQYCTLLLEKEPSANWHNLLTTINVESEMLELISHVANVSKSQAQKIFDAITLNNINRKNHIFTRSAPPPLVQISEHQYLRSICGCLDRPFEFLLDELRFQYPKDWDKNTKQRETKFKNELYHLFNNDNIKVQREIKIKTNGKVITDIDACIIDKNTGDIGFFQLKWQDVAYKSNRTLLSKQSNFEKKTIDWVNATIEWIKETSCKQLGDYIGISPKYIEKSKIRLFVLGRFDCNFSNSNTFNTYPNVAWGQWYQIIDLMRRENLNELSLLRLFELLLKNNPSKKIVLGPSKIYEIGDFSIQEDYLDVEKLYTEMFSDN